jgi:DNA-binding transcriptional MerR regulator
MSKAAAANGDTLTIDELARETGMTVRNIRAHQSRGLLPPPEVRGRTGFYGAAHASRIELIRELQGDGFKLEAISRLLDSAGGSSEEVLRFTRAVKAPFEDERPEVIDADELTERFGRPDRDPRALRRAEKLGIVVPLGEGRYEVPSPTLLRAGETLLVLGIPLDKALDVIEDVARQADSVAAAFVKLFLERVWKPFDRAGQPEPDWPAVLAALEQLRPLATEVLVAIFQPRMTQATEKAFGRELQRRAKR